MNETIKVALVQYLARHGHMTEHRTLAEKALDQLEADAQALADVRTLDEWRKRGGSGRGWHMGEGGYGESTKLARCELVDYTNGIKYFHAPTPDAARHAAAEWVRSQK